ncbi:hypothetical protein OG320_10385 [Microbispora sp. NBC_01189]|uniref:hypothetical protein n=1 Tax=unclassified Microbispora TaxID=2614687 RepID=UPI002E1333C3|nr:hypothetical protein OG320_10385 [Microbispora sp. NBC_01189]
MWLDAELSPRSLHDAEDFTALKVTARREDHVWLTREDIIRLAGDHGRDPEWRGRLDRMLEYAASKGWVDDAGAVRAHVEWT